MVRSAAAVMNVPDERGLALLGHPRLDVVGGHDAVEKPAASAAWQKSSSSCGANCSSIAA